MKSKQALLILLKEALEEGFWFQSGLCNLVGYLDVTETEKARLLQIIESNPRGHGRGFYYFPRGEIAPRIKYLDSLIVKYTASSTNTEFVNKEKQ